MPKLPTWGGLDYQRAEHPNAPLDLDGYGRGTQAMGAALFKTGATIARAAEDQADKEDKLTQANAGSTLLLGIGELKRKAEEDRDPNDFAQRYEPQVKKLYEQSFASIRDPYQRQLFEARMRPHMQTDIDAFTKRGKTLRDDVDKAGSDQRLFGIGQAMDATKDDAEKQRLMGEARREIDGRVQRGWLTLEQAGEIKRDWANKRGVTWLESKPPAERMRILETRPTPTGLVPPVNGTFVGGPASQFGARRGIGRLHAGVDWQAPNGSPAASAIDGKVVYTGNHSGYGNMVDVLGADGNVHRYALHEGDVGVKIGDAVKAGQQIGTVGGGHVHNEIIRKDTPAWQAATAGTFGGTSRRPGSESQTIDPAEVYGLKPGTKVSSSAALPPAARRDHPIIGMLAPGQRQVLYERAEREYRAENRAANAGIDVGYENALTQARDTGEVPPNAPTLPVLIERHGEVQGAAKFAALQQTAQLGKDIASFSTMTDEQASAFLKSKAPVLNSETYAQDAKRYEVLQQAYTQDRAAREKDPFSYVVRSNPALAKTFENLDPNDTGAVSAAIGMADSLQAQIGVRPEKRMLLPKTALDAAVKRFNDEALPQDQRIASLTSLLFSTNNPQQRQRIMAQMEAAGVDGMWRGVFDVIARGDAGAARRLAMAAMMKTDDLGKLPGRLPAGVTPAQIDQAIQDGLMAPGQIGDAVYGIRAGLAENAKRAVDDGKLIRNAAMIDLMQGGSANPTDAVKKVIKDRFGDVKIVSKTDALFTLPSAEDDGAVLAGLRSIAGSEVRDNLMMRKPPLPANATPEQKRAYDFALRDMERSTEDLLGNGQWRMGPGGFVFMDKATGGVVAGRDGKPLVVPLDLAKSVGRAVGSGGAEVPAPRPRLRGGEGDDDPTVPRAQPKVMNEESYRSFADELAAGPAAYENQDAWFKTWGDPSEAQNYVENKRIDATNESTLDKVRGRGEMLSKEDAELLSSMGDYGSRNDPFVKGDQLYGAIGARLLSVLRAEGVPLTQADAEVKKLVRGSIAQVHTIANKDPLVKLGFDLPQTIFGVTELNAAGVFNKRTDRVAIPLANAKSAGDLADTLLHESVHRAVAYIREKNPNVLGLSGNDEEAFVGWLERKIGPGGGKQQVVTADEKTRGRYEQEYSSFLKRHNPDLLYQKLRAVAQEELNRRERKRGPR